MRRLTETEQRATNGGWCFALNFWPGYTGYNHYINGWYIHSDYYQGYSLGWYYYG